MLLTASPGAFASLVSLPRPRLHENALDQLLGNEQVLVQRNFLAPSLVSALLADHASLRARAGGGPTAIASALHGSVEWRMLLPDGPTLDEVADDAVGLRGRDMLLSLVADLSSQIEDRTGVALDADCELKYAYYPCGGRYQRHIDGMNAGSIAREYSFLLYLNEHWTPADGGHLRIFNGSGQHRDIAPEAGTLVMFKSDVVPHEVRPTTAERMAIVGWLHRHQEPPEMDEESLSELGRALLEHYRLKGETIKLPSS